MSGIESEVTQADRDAAARIVEAADRHGAATIRAGEWDHHAAVIVCAAHRQAAYAAGIDAERERIIKGLRDDASQTEVDARRILGKLIKLTPADIDDWAKLVAMKHSIADMLERSSAAIAAATEGGA